MSRNGLVGFVLALVVVTSGVSLFAYSVAGTGAYFTDSQTGSINGNLLIATPPPVLSATVRIEPQTIDLAAGGTITAFIDALPVPHAVSEIDLGSVALCYKAACVASRGPAKVDGKAHLSAKFDQAGLTRLVGSSRGALTFIVRGRLIAGGKLAGSHINRVTGDAGGGHGTRNASPVPITPPTPSVEPSASGAPSASPSPTTTATPRPSPKSSPKASPSPSPKPSASPAPTASPPVPDPLPAPSSVPTAQPTPDPSPAP